MAGFIRLEPGTTKNKEGRSFYVTDELRTLLQAQLASIAALKERGTICPYIFHREDGGQIKSMRKLWEDAREKAGHATKILHEFRRTAVRNLERAGVPRSTAMQMSATRPNRSTAVTRSWTSKCTERRQRRLTRGTPSRELRATGRYAPSKSAARRSVKDKLKSPEN